MLVASVHAISAKTISQLQLMPTVMPATRPIVTLSRTVYRFLRDSRMASVSRFATTGPRLRTVRATVGPCFFAEAWAAWRIALRWAGGIRFQAWRAFNATSTLFQGIALGLPEGRLGYAAENRSATLAQSTVFHHASM